MDTALEAMSALTVDTAIVSVSTPGTTFLPDAGDAAGMARDVNDYAADIGASDPKSFGFFATVPMPHIDLAATRSAMNHLDVLALLPRIAGQT